MYSLFPHVCMQDLCTHAMSTRENNLEWLGQTETFLFCCYLLRLVIEETGRTRMHWRIWSLCVAAVTLIMNKCKLREDDLWVQRMSVCLHKRGDGTRVTVGLLRYLIVFFPLILFLIQITYCLFHPVFTASEVGWLDLTNPQVKEGTHTRRKKAHVQTHWFRQLMHFMPHSAQKASQTQGIHKHQMWEHAEIH